MSATLPCVACGTSTVEAGWCCGLPYCDSCLDEHVCTDPEEHG
jgi:hypothetical protein